SPRATGRDSAAPSLLRSFGPPWRTLFPYTTLFRSGGATNTGTIQATAGPLTFNGTTVANTGGTILSTGNTLKLTNSTVNGGSVTMGRADTPTPVTLKIHIPSTPTNHDTRNNGEQSG